MVSKRKRPEEVSKSEFAADEDLGIDKEGSDDIFHSEPVQGCLQNFQRLHTRGSQK